MRLALKSVTMKYDEVWLDQNWSWLVLPAEFYHYGDNMRGIFNQE